MFQVTQSKKQITVETGNAVYQWDAARGAQLSQLILKDGPARRALIDPDHAAPNLTLKLPTGAVRIVDYPAKLTIDYQEPGYLVFSTRAQIDGRFTFEQTYEVFRESVVFCEFRLMVNQRKRARITSADIGFDLNLCRATNVRSNAVTRDPYLKQDVTTTHVLSEVKVAMPRTETIETQHLTPMFGLDLAWDDTRCYSHRVELIMEDDSSIGGEMLAPTATTSRQRGGRWRHQWKLARGNKQTFTPPFFYRNKWALFVGCARTEAGPKADPVRRNNLLGARVCHVMYPYIYGLRNFPWCSVPVRQTFYQDVQLATEQPPIRTVDQAAKLGCNVLLIHQFWMKNGGSNGEPQANYQVHDPKWFKAFVKRAHDHGMRVALYMRGVEHYMLYMDFFEKYLKKNWDGLYADWATPFAMGFAKSTTRHSSVYNYFMFMRALRKRVGEGGFLIGHTNMQSVASYANFDATVTGEFSVLHSGLLAEPEISASYCGLSCVGVHLIAGNSPDRAEFSSPKAAAYAAGLGWANHPFAEPGLDFAKTSAFTKPLWDLINKLESDPVRMYTPNAAPESFAQWSRDELRPLAYRDKAGNVLILVTNLSKRTVTGHVDIDRARLDSRSKAKLKPLKVRNTPAAAVRDDRILLTKLKPYEFCGVMLPADR